MTRIQRFCTYFNEAARAADIDLQSPRGGGRSMIAERLGVSRSTVARWADGESMPSDEYWEPLAEVLGVRLRTFIVRSGIFSIESLTEENGSDVRLRPITPTEALDELDIDDPDDRSAISAVIEAARRRQKRADGSTGGGAAAEG
jgi:transcriptional regulator with XRE-family HTH domain